MTAEATDPTTSEPGGETVSRLAAIVFDRDEGVAVARSSRRGKYEPTRPGLLVTGAKTADS
jgi:hypothetical protein